MREISIVAWIGTGCAEAAEIRTLMTNALTMRVRGGAIDPQRTQAAHPVPPGVEMIASADCEDVSHENNSVAGPVRQLPAPRLLADRGEFLCVIQSQRGQ